MTHRNHHHLRLNTSARVTGHTPPDSPSPTTATHRPVHGLPQLPRLAAALVLLMLALASLDASAQKRLALVIGNGDYVHESRLPNPTNDARLIARTLRGLGFSVEEKLNLRQREMTLTIARFVRESAGADTAVLYFAGHGMQPVAGGRNYLLPVDANIEHDDALDADAIPADRIVDQLERQANPARLRLVVLDACRNNRQLGRARTGIRGLARMTPSDDYTLIAFSTNDQDVALDGRGANSPYAEALSRHLARASELPLRRVFELTATDVRAATNQKQRPRTYGDLDSRVGLDGLVLAPAAAEPRRAPDTSQVEQQAWVAAQRAATAAAYTAYLAEYPTGRFASAARVALAALQPPAQPAMGAAGSVLKDCAGCPELVVVPGGSFMMGSLASELGRHSTEGPQRRVTIQSFAAGRTEVTFAQWDACVAAGGCSHRPDDNGWGRGSRPVVDVNWDDAQQYVAWLRGKTGKYYRLLSEAEWEYAARAGTSTPFHTGQRLNPSQANFDSGYSYNDSAKVESRQRTVPVRQFAPNAFGLSDMHGNVWEWVQDVWHGDYSGAPSDGSVWLTGGDQGRRVLRGGSWYSTPGDLRSANRISNSPAIRSFITGLRIARAL